MTPMTAAAIPPALPPLRLSPLSPSPTTKSRTAHVSSSLWSSIGRGSPPWGMAEAAVSHYAVPSPRLRRRCSCLRSRRSSGNYGYLLLRGPKAGITHSSSASFGGATMSAVELETSLALKAKAAELLSALKGTSLFLIGMNNRMKTSLGKALAEALRYYYFDSDRLVEEAAGGESAARDFRERDERGFCDSETEVLKQLSSMGRLVVCAGDGAVQTATNLSYLRYGISIWVDVPIDVVADEMLNTGDQLSNAQGVSMSDNEVLTELAKRYDDLKEGFSTADATVSLLRVASKLGYDDLSIVTPEDMALEVLKEIEKLTRVKKMMEDAARPF